MDNIRILSYNRGTRKSRIFKIASRLDKTHILEQNVRFTTPPRPPECRGSSPSQGQNRRQYMVFAHRALASCKNPQKPTRILTFSPHGPPRGVPEHPLQPLSGATPLKDSPKRPPRSTPEHPFWPHTASKSSGAPPAPPEHPGDIFGVQILQKKC